MYKTTVISDLHLGSKAARREDIIKFLDGLKTEVLILNGDIIDGWALERGSKWTKKDSKIIRRLLKMSENGVEVIWVRGNHDEFIKDFIPMVLGDIKMVEDYIIQYNNVRYYIFHGDVLDVFITKIKWLAYIGSIGYDIALWLNRWYNKWRSFRGLPYYSISRDIKNGIKQATSFINDFEDNAIKLAKQKGCQVAICGHIHQPSMKGNYFNSGDWCENCTALVETKNGEWELIYFHK